MSGTGILEGLNVLILEDDFLISCSLEEDIRLLGCSVVGPFSNLARAREAIRHVPVDFAVLDINLNGEMSYPLADDLTAQKVPFLFLTGYGASALPERFRQCPRVAKPYDPANLSREIRRVVQAAAPLARD